ncbi:MAG TPA: hypothetical protein VFU82_08115 [Gammaproteobacteria bacterium]|nr:hypothetical protein [Gammaproteobacteria bacterium]
MINIKKSDILGLINHYKEVSQGRGRKLVGSVPPIVSSLERFVDSLPADDAPLNNIQLYYLAIILLTRKKSTRLLGDKPTASEVLATQLEAQLGDEMFTKQVKSQFDNNTLTQSSFDEICKNFNAPNNINIILPPSGHVSEPRKEEKKPSSSPRLAPPPFLSKLFGGETKLQKLLNHISIGEINQAEVIWSKNPELLLKKGRVKRKNEIPLGSGNIAPFEDSPGFYEYSDRTAYQIALMNEEFEAAKKMHEHMSPEEIIKQFDEVFPGGEIKNMHIDLEEGKAKLKNLFLALTKTELHNDESAREVIIPDEAKRLLHELYSYAKPNANVSQGLVFDSELYYAAMELYRFNIQSFKHGVRRTGDDPDNPNLSYDHRYALMVFWCVRVEAWLAGCLGTANLRRYVRGWDSHPSVQPCDTLDPYYSYQEKNLVFGKNIRVTVTGIIASPWSMPGSMGRGMYPPGDRAESDGEFLHQESRRGFFDAKQQERKAFSELIAGLRQYKRNKP